jgi:hypothetical protein
VEAWGARRGVWHDARIDPVSVDLPVLDGVEHRYIKTAAGVTIHVVDAGPSEGPPVMLVHGFPQHWLQGEYAGPATFRFASSPGSRIP